MTKKPIKFFALTLLAVLLCSSLFACTSTGDNGGDTTGGGDGDTTSVIKSLTAKQASVSMKVGDDLLLTSYYDIEGFAPLKTAQKACTYESSDSSVVEINAKKAKAVGPGSATITITSEKDTTKTCSFDVVVSRVFFDREITYIPSGDAGDDFTNEFSETTLTGSIRTLSAVADKSVDKSANYYYAADVLSTKWYVETNITVNDYLPLDEFPKVGIVASNKGVSGQDETMVAFFFNITPKLPVSDTDPSLRTKWNEFGVSEVSKGGHWAWEAGYTNAVARHHDYCWNTGANYYGIGDTFKLGVARDGLEFHVWINDKYVGTHKLSTSLEILYDGSQALASHVGFYYFSVDATFSNYLATTDNNTVNGKIPSTKVYIADEWANKTNGEDTFDANGYLIDDNDVA